MYQYKVISQKDKWFSSKFDPERIESALNAYAQQGWRLVVGTTADFGGGVLSGNFVGSRNEFIGILEREVNQEDMLLQEILQQEFEASRESAIQDSKGYLQELLEILTEDNSDEVVKVLLADGRCEFYPPIKQLLNEILNSNSMFASERNEITAELLSLLRQLTENRN